MTLEDRVNVVISICNMEIERQKMFMHLAEHKDKDSDWIRHYSLQNAYENIKHILCGDFSINYYLGEDKDLSYE